MHASRFCIALLLLLGTGCARYEYDILQPGDFAGRVGEKSDVAFDRPPLEYRLRTVENRLVMRIYNPTDSPITLLGERSSAVDPDGQSHPLPTQTIAPQSFVKLILPPFRPRIERTGPSIGIGVGGIFTGRDRRLRHYDPIPEPQYFSVYDGNALYWEWEGESTVRLTLVFDQAGKLLEQQFTLARRKLS